MDYWPCAGGPCYRCVDDKKRNEAYGELANALEGLENRINELDPQKDAATINRLNEMAKSLKGEGIQLPLIHRVTVEKHFPSSLTIRVQESSPVVAYFQGSHATVYSERGLMLPMSTSTAFHLPVVDSMAFEKIVDVAAHLQKLKQDNAELYGLVSQVSWSEEHGAYEVFFSDVGYKVLFPEGEWDRNLWTLYESVKRGFSQDMNCSGEVDLRFSGFLYIRNVDKRWVNG